MATALDVISLNDAKNYLVVDLTDTFYDADITRMIKTSVASIEKYTDWALYARDVTIPMTGCEQDIYTFPVIVNSVQKAAVDQTYTTLQRALRIVVQCSAWNGSVIGVTIGDYGEDTPPDPLIAACYKLLTYLFENKDAYEATIPYDIQLLINQYRRGSSSI